MLKDYGFHPSIIYSTHWFGGALPKDILQADGNWFSYLPTYDSQAVSFETFACTTFGTGHCVEVLINKIFASKPNYSERYHYNLVGILPPSGGDPQAVAESVRKNGMIDQTELPMTSTLQEFETPRPMTQDYLSLGQKWLLNQSFGHEWVWTTTLDKTTRVSLLKEYLQYSPLGISVTAWYPPVDGMYPDNGAANTHWVMCYGMDGDSPLIFDSYAQDGSPLKKLSPDHHIEMCKRYYIGPAISAPEKLSWISGMIKAILQSLGFISNEIKQMPTQPVTSPVVPETAPVSPVSLSQRLYDLSYSLIGKTLTLDSSVPASYSCAEALSCVLKKFGYTMPTMGIASTVGMDGWLLLNCTKIDSPEVGDIIISVTQGNNHGHCGIVGKNAIMSNDSQTGEWQPYWSLKAWLEFYQVQKKLITKYYRLK